MCEPLDRYVIRTRNLQDWNLTRYRCANQSVEVISDAAAARVDGALLAPRLARPALAVAAGVDLALLRALVVACVASVSSSAHVSASMKRRCGS